MANNAKKLINFRATEAEQEKLNAFCLSEGRTVTDVLRSFIRKLPVIKNIKAEQKIPETAKKEAKASK
jgi:hypothetical protein